MKNLNWKSLCSRVARCAGAIAAVSLGTAALAQQVEKQVEAADANVASGNSALLERNDVQFLVSTPDVARQTRTNRAPPPVPGGGCQANGDFVNLVTGTVNLANILTTTTTAFADNFRTTGAAAPTVSQLSWSAAGRVGTTTFTDSPAFTSFNITIYNDGGGFPGTQVALTQIITGTNLTSTNSGTLAGFTLRDYVATLPNPIALNPNTCYWVEIRPTSFAANQQYLHRTSNQGDGAFWARTTATFASNGVVNGDLNFCFNIPIASVADGLSCPLGSAMSCFSSPGFTTCQVWDGTGQGQSAHIVGGSDFRLADNFTINTAQTVTGVCFLGFYGGTAAVPTPETFRVRFFPDGTPGGVPNDSSPLLELTLTTGTPGPNGETITRGGAAIPGSTRAFNYTVNFGTNTLLLQPGCYWLEIQNQSSTTVTWFWLNKANARAATIADAYRQQRNNTTTPAYGVNTQVFSGDLSWCLNGVSLVRSTTCLPVPAQLNTSCATATTLNIGAAPTFGHNLAEVPPTAAIPFDCLSDIPNANGVWYRVVGNGQDVTISTCNTGSNPFAAATDFDTVISVYCTRGVAPDECTGGFVCIGSNDDTPAPGCAATTTGASTITFPTVAGQVYYAYVYGFEAGNGVIDTGFFYVNATASGTPSNPPAVACANLNNCVIDIPAGAVVETDVCGTGGTNSDCANAVPLPLGTFGTGRVSNDGALRDFDFWRLPDVNNPAGGEWFLFEFRAEFPGFLQIGRGTCTAGAVPLIQFGFDACTSASSFRVFVPNGELYVNLSVASFNNLPCFAGNVGNRYIVRVSTTSAVGACCIPATACLVTARSDGVIGGTEPQDCEAQGGVYLGDGTVCGPNNAPCDPNGGAPAGAIVGSCCLPFAECAVTTDTTCTGGTFLAAGLCTPNTCASPVATCCFGTGTCLITADAAACTTAGGSPQAVLRACTPNACPVTPTGGCCNAAFVCSTTTQAACVGTYLGDNVACTPANCTPPPAGVCCRGTTCNSTVAQAACTTTGTQWGAAFTNSSGTCNASGVGTAPCCFADYDKTGGIQTGDIFAFLNDWFASSPFAVFGGNGTGTPQTGDIFSFLNAWFAGGC
ncbi:MAG: hypothetical protein K2W85_12755 [Phycisphaerales bacterium]|nr:hypothetical protein [Phycisphaerales bacterium]